MSDMNISLDEANAWVSKVEAEIADVNKVLKKAVACVKDCENSEDTIYQNLSAAANCYETAWNQLENGYRKVFEGLRASFKSQMQAIEQGVEAIKAEARKAKS